MKALLTVYTAILVSSMGFGSIPHFCSQPEIQKPEVIQVILKEDTPEVVPVEEVKSDEPKEEVKKSVSLPHHRFIKHHKHKFHKHKHHKDLCFHENFLFDIFNTECYNK